jgi:hypothetical protein
VPFQDYHRRGLCPEIWRSDTELKGKVRSGIMDALDRFKPVRAFLLGSLTGHYYDPASSVDVLIQIDPSQLDSALEEAQNLEQRYVPGTSQPLHVVPVSTAVAPKVLQQKFGPLYDLFGSVWLGTRASTKAELAEPKALLRRINWRIFKARKSLEDFTTRFWEIEQAVFGDLVYAEQLEVLEELGYRIRRLDHYLDKSLLREPREVWKATEQLEQNLLAALDRGDDVVELLRAATTVPARTREIVLQRLRYEDLLTTLRDDAAEQKELDTITDSMKSLPINAGTRNAMTTTSFHPVVTLRGGVETLDQLGAKLASRHPKKVLRSSANTLVLTEVSTGSAQRLAAMAPQLGVEVDLGEALEVEVPLPRTAPKVAAPADPALDPGKWYFAEAKEDVYPFVQARELTAKGWAVELLTASNAVPTRQVLSAEELAGFGLRPATEADFDAMDLPVPSSKNLVQADIKFKQLPVDTSKPGPKHVKRKGLEKLVRTKKTDPYYVSFEPPSEAQRSELERSEELLANLLLEHGGKPLPLGADDARTTYMLETPAGTLRCTLMRGGLYCQFEDPSKAEALGLFAPGQLGRKWNFTFDAGLGDTPETVVAKAHDAFHRLMSKGKKVVASRGGLPAKLLRTLQQVARA